MPAAAKPVDMCAISYERERRCLRATRSTEQPIAFARCSRGACPSSTTPHPRHRADRWPERLAGRAVRSVDAHGKHLFLRFEGDLTLHSHLRMTGLWVVCREGGRWRRSPRRAWLVLRSEGWEAVEFDGPLLELTSDFRARSDPRIVALGQDVLGERFDNDLYLARLRAGDPTRGIGEILLDQGVLAGIGNLWKSELCFGRDRPVAKRRRDLRRGGDRARDVGTRADAQVGAIRAAGASAHRVQNGRPAMPALWHARYVREVRERSARTTLVPGCQR